jgi:AraC-like DNA-binding protein
MYREWAPPPELRHSVACLWERASDPEHGETVRVLPDACTDVMWIDGELQVAGPDTTAQFAALPPGSSILGVRFRTGAGTPLLGVDASELTDQRVDLDELWGRESERLRDRLASTRSAEAAAKVMCRTVTELTDRSGGTDPIVDAAVRLTGHPDAPPLQHIAHELGVSERQLRRRAHVALGYGLKTLERILRFQRFLTLARATAPGRLAITAAEAGYADQAHLARECRGLAGLSPTALLADRQA